MPWNNPLPTLAADGTPTAAQLNQYLQNMDWLHAPPKASYEQSGTADATTTSTTWGTINSNFATTIVTTGGQIMANFAATMDNLDIDWSVDGTRVTSSGTAGTGALRADAAAAYVQGQNLPMFWDDIPAGTHTFAVQWKASSGTGTLYGSYQPRFFVREF